MGRTEGKAPTPLSIVVQQLNGADPLVEKLARPLIDREKYPSMHANDGWEAQIWALAAAELADNVDLPERRTALHRSVSALVPRSTNAGSAGVERSAALTVL